MTEKTTFVFKIAITGLPDSDGLRIKSVEPCGLYLSMRNRGAAQLWFERFVLEYALQRSFVHFKPGGGACLADRPLNWDALILVGEGEITVRTVSVEEAAETVREGTPVIIEEHPRPYADWWQAPLGDLLVIRDEKDRIDPWLVLSIQADLERLGVTPTAARG